MSFFSASVSRDGRTLSFGMNPLLRGGILFFLLSIAAMFLFVFTPENFREAPTIGKINTVVLPVLLLLASLVEYRITFDRRDGSITIRKGLVILAKAERFRFEDLHGVKKASFRAHTLELFGTRACFGLYLGSKLVILDRSIPAERAESFYNILVSYFPRQVPVLE